MAKLIPLPSEEFKKLSPRDRVEAKLLLYRKPTQEVIQYIRKTYGMEKPTALPSLDRDGLCRYARQLVDEWGGAFFSSADSALDIDWLSNYWIHFVCIFAKHHVLLPPDDLEEFTDEEAYASLEKDRADRWAWEGKCRARPNYDDERFDIEEFTEMKEEALEEQYELAKKSFEIAKKRHSDKQIMESEDYSPFDDRIVYSSPRVTVSMRLNKVKVHLNSRATKEDMLKAWHHVERCQRMIKSGKGKAAKHDEELLDIYNEIAALMSECEKEGLSSTATAKKINDELNNIQKLKYYKIGSMSKVMQRVRTLEF